MPGWLGRRGQAAALVTLRAGTASADATAPILNFSLFGPNHLTEPGATPYSAYNSRNSWQMLFRSPVPPS